MTVQLTLSTCLGQGSRRNITLGKTVESIGSLEGSRRVSKGLKGSGNISLVLRYVFPHVRKDTTKVSQHIDNDSMLVSFKMNFKTDETLNV